jgi:transposase
MIGLPPGTKVFLACQPIDLRAGFDGLAAKVQQSSQGAAPCPISCVFTTGRFATVLRKTE